MQLCLKLRWLLCVINDAQSSNIAASLMDVFAVCGTVTVKTSQCHFSVIHF